MKTFFLFLFGLMSIDAFTQSSFTYPSLIVEFDSAIIFKNLKLIPIKRTGIGIHDNSFQKESVITLQQGLQKESVKIKERGDYMVDNINVLLIENKSSKSLFLKSGDIISGGRQDRVIAKDTILPPGKQHTIPVYCIEENRWSNHEKKFEYKGTAAAGLQKIIDSAHSQTKLWDEIRRLLKANNQTSSSSYAALLTNKKVVDTSNQYLRYFLPQFSKRDSSIVGFIASTGTHVLGADVFVTADLFYQTLPSLLSKYSTEAILHGATAAEDNRKEKAYSDEILSPLTQQAFILKHGKMIYYKGNLIQLTGYSFHQ